MEVCVKLAPVVQEKLGKADPGQIVADEFAGQAIVFAAVGGLAANEICITAAVGFALFRLFDILKPWPIKKLEKFKGGWGVVADDLAAGAAAAVLLKIFLTVWRLYY